MKADDSRMDDLPLDPELQDRLRRWEPPHPTPAQTIHLIETLASRMPEAHPQRNTWRQPAEWAPLLLLRAQMRVVRGEIWVASALVMGLGTAVTLAAYQPDAAHVLPLTVLAPLMAAGGVALLYDSDLEAVLELENTTPTSVRLLLLARLTLVFGFNLLLALVGSTALAILHTDISLWPLVLAWLAPMTFLSGVAFFISIITGDSAAGALMSMGLWGLHLFIRALSASSDITAIVLLLGLPGLGAAENHPLLFVAALALAAAGLWLAGRGEHRFGAERV